MSCSEGKGAHAVCSSLSKFKEEGWVDLQDEDVEGVDDPFGSDRKWEGLGSQCDPKGGLPFTYFPPWGQGGGSPTSVLFSYKTFKGFFELPTYPNPCNEPGLKTV